MIKKRIKKIIKLTGLISVRQGWKLGENLYHLTREPVLTIKTLIKDKDKSQIFLLTIFFLAPILSYIGARIVWDYYKYGLVIGAVGKLFIIVALVQLVLMGYLAYWLTRVIQKKHD